VAHVLDLGQARGVDYLVSEYVEGETLEELLKKRGKLNCAAAARIFAIAFDALGALHDHKVSAGELSAGCLVFTAADRTPSARTVRIVNAVFPRRLFDASALGLVSGEQLPEGARPTGPADRHLSFDGAPRPEEDIVRLGALLYRSVTGQEPYPAGESPRPGRAPTPVRQAVPDVPDLLADLLDRLMDPSPGGRPRSAAAVAKALRVFLRTEEESRPAGVEDSITVPAPSLPAGLPADEEEEPGDGAAEAPVVAPSVMLAPEVRERRPAAAGQREPDINKFFRTVMKMEGSDLHLATGCPPMMRLRNAIRPMDMPPLTLEDMERLVDPILTQRARRLLDETGGADFAHVVGKEGARFRVNLFRQRGQLSLVARRVNTKIPTFEGLHLPPLMEKLCQYDQGMVILAGVTGSGKSTTLAAMLDYINEREQVHILTIEDPIEYLFTRKKAVINQREVGIDVADWAVALKHAVRQDPDVILVGEMRDRETFEAGLNAAETGHLVFGTIHASSAPSTIGRILDLFPADMHNAIRQSLAFNLKAIVCQKLLPSIKPGLQRVPANEIMTMNPTMRDLITKGEDEKLPDAIRIGLLEGMIDFNESLRQLVARGDVDRQVALMVSPNPDALKMAFKGIKVAQPGIL
jgi:twitching motility protein PilT